MKCLGRTLRNLTRASVISAPGTDFGRFWQVVEKHKVNSFYTAPTALRALMREGNAFVKKWDRSSIKLLGTVGETIKEPEWNWYYSIVGENRCPIVDTWWQTETGV